MRKLTTGDIPLCDPYVYKFIGTGKTKGIFQIESPGMQKLMKDMFSDVTKRINAIETKYNCTGYKHLFNGIKKVYQGPETDKDKIEAIETAYMNEMNVLGKELFERIIAAISLYRPGPMDYIPQYIAGMKDPSAIVYDCPELEEILSNTYGVIVYQEQVQQIVRKLAGYSLGRGDLIRRAMGKKKTAIMDAEKEVFLYGNEEHLKENEAIVPGCIKNGITESAAKIIWDKMAEFAKYAFNKSHSAGYAVICVQTAWMKYYYPVDFIVATLNSVIDKADKLKGYIAEARDMGIEILTPDVNKSDLHYKIEGSNQIRTGLMALRNMGKMSIPIIEERNKNGTFSNIYDFINRLITQVDKKVLEALTYAGAFDCFGYSRSALITAVPDVIDYIKYVKKGIFNEIFFSLPIVDKVYAKLGEIHIEDGDEFDKDYLLEKEYEFTGMYISGHPLDLYEDLLSEKGVVNIEEIVPEADEETGERDESPFNGQPIQIAGVVRELKPIITKKGDKMYMFSIEDKSSTIKCVAFPRTATSIESKFKLEDSLLLSVSGKVQDNDRGCQIVVDDVSLAKDLDITSTKKVYIDCRPQKTVNPDLSKFITDNAGETEVWVKLAGGWIISKTKLKLDWANYIKLKGMYPIKLG